ncbi:hypothetical protein HDV63DRAFT_384259 [Trichoderma sp. SZMC 28014]
MLVSVTLLWSSAMIKSGCRPLDCCTQHLCVEYTEAKLHPTPSHLVSSAIQQPCCLSLFALSAQFFSLICNPRPDDRNGGVRGPS